MHAEPAPGLRGGVGSAVVTERVLGLGELCQPPVQLRQGAAGEAPAPQGPDDVGHLP